MELTRKKIASIFLFLIVSLLASCSMTWTDEVTSTTDEIFISQEINDTFLPTLGEEPEEFSELLQLIAESDNEKPEVVISEEPEEPEEFSIIDFESMNPFEESFVTNQTYVIDGSDSVVDGNDESNWVWVNEDVDEKEFSVAPEIEEIIVEDEFRPVQVKNHAGGWVFLALIFFATIVSITIIKISSRVYRENKCRLLFLEKIKEIISALLSRISKTTARFKTFKVSKEKNHKSKTEKEGFDPVTQALVNGEFNLNTEVDEKTQK